ncbi:FimV family protein [Dyella tabacisoli]|nr:hypothetical protein [Dyella tabacisoli]
MNPVLGRSWVRSSHRQPLIVDIPLVNTCKSDISRLRIIAKGSMIDPRLKGRATEIANHLTFTHTVRSIGNEQHFIRLTSKEVITRPQVNLHVTVDGPSGIVHRSYSIQPRIEIVKKAVPPAPATTPPKATATATTATPAQTPSVPPQLKIVPPAPAPPPAPAAGQGATLHAGRPGSEASSIATAIKQLNGDLTRLQRLVSTVQHIATRQAHTLEQQRYEMEHIHSKARAVVGKARAVQESLDHQAKQLSTLRANVAVLSDDFDVPQATPAERTPTGSSAKA